MDQSIDILVTCEDSSLIPKYADVGSSGVDLIANIPKQLTIYPGERLCIPTGIRVIIPEGWEIQIRPRSGLALKNGVSVLNTPGTIDSSYRGEIGIILINLGQYHYIIEPKSRIAQAVLCRVPKMNFIEVSTEEFESSKTSRGEGGFGSTGV